jgi:hypothetical protein
MFFRFYVLFAIGEKNKVFTHHLSILGGGQEQRHGGFFGERAGFYHLNRLSSI